MTMFMLNGQPLAIDTPFIAGDIQYPANWLRLSSIEEKLGIGITEAPDPEPYDDRFYWGPGNPKDLDTLKANWIANVNQIAYTLLASSDWMVTRKIETGTDIPADWATYRAQVRADCVTNKSSVTASIDLPSLITAVGNFVWPRNPDATL
jgi:hypothetical protein